MSSFDWDHQVSGSVKTLNKAMEDGKVSEKEYANVLSEFQSARAGGFGVERLIGFIASSETNMNGRTDAFRKAFAKGTDEHRLLADHVTQGRSFSEFSAALRSLRDSRQ